MAGRIVTCYLQVGRDTIHVSLYLLAGIVKCSVCPSFVTWPFSVLVGWFNDNHSCQTSALTCLLPVGLSVMLLKTDHD